jgi:hypothetical protein
LDEETDELVGNVLIYLEPGVKVVGGVDRFSEPEYRIGEVGFSLTIDPPGDEIRTLTFDPGELEEYPEYQGHTLYWKEIYPITKGSQ